jgi:hypothetical protein
MSIGWVAAATAVGGMYSANKASKASDKATSAARDMASDQLALNREELDFYKIQYADQKPLQQEQARIANEVSTAQLASMKQNDTIAKDYYDYQTGTFRPMEKSIVSDAQNYDTTARREDKAGQAVADVGMQAEVARQSNMRQMQRMGVNPNSGKMLAMGNQMSLGEATAKAGAANKARDAVETQGYARKMDAVNLGRNLPSNQATSAGVALTAGNSAVTNATTPINTINGMTQTMGQGYNAASNGMTSAHNMINQANNNQATMWGNAATGFLSSAGTMAGTYFGQKKIP